MKNFFSTALVRSILIISAVVVAGLVFLLGEPAGLVDWRETRAIVLESDDWGFAGFIPAADAWQGLTREELGTGGFPEIYWHSTLEDSATVATLCTLLGSYAGRDGLPPILQANYILSSLDWTEEGGWRRFDLPEFPEPYLRPGLWTAVSQGVAEGVWRPEFHGTWHYDPQIRKTQAASNDLAKEVTRRGIVLFPGSERARELGPWRSSSELEAELDGSLESFRALFSRSPSSVVAPDYTWDARVESLWESRDLVIIQGKREQRNAAFGGGIGGRIRKYIGRRWDQTLHPQRCYLERNCRLETAQAPDPGLAVQECLASVESAWSRGQPAIVETHRVNYSHTDAEVVHLGTSGLASFLTQVMALTQGKPVFLVDFEVAQLAKYGTSVCRRGQSLVLRNGTHSRKLLPLPARSPGGDDGGDFLALEPGQVVVLKFVN